MWIINNSIPIPWPPDDAEEDKNSSKGEWDDYITSEDADWFSVKELWINGTMKVQPRLTDHWLARLYVPKGPAPPRDNTPNNRNNSAETGNWDSEWSGCVFRTGFVLRGVQPPFLIEAHALELLAPIDCIH